MEQTGQFNNRSNADYWQSILIATLLVGLVSSVFPIIFGYITIGLEPSGSIVQIFVPMIGFCMACLVGGLGGFISTWHYIKSNNILIELGRGALIGFLTGIAILIFNTLFEQLWNLIDPDFMENLRTSLITILEETGLPEDQKQMQIDSIASQYSSNKSFGEIAINFGIGIFIYGLLNLLSGMLGVSIFGRKK